MPNPSRWYAGIQGRDPVIIGAVPGLIMSRCTSKQCHQGRTQNAQPPVLVERFCYGTGWIIRLTFETGQPCRKIADFLPSFRHDGSTLSEIALPNGRNPWNFNVFGLPKGANFFGFSVHFFDVFYRHSLGRFSIVSVHPCPFQFHSGSKLGQEQGTPTLLAWRPKFFLRGGMARAIIKVQSQV